MLSPEELLKVANAYAEATNLSLITVGRFACNNDKIFPRISEGGGALSRSIEQATLWFELNWPKGLRWPSGVPGGPRGGARRGTSIGASRKKASTTVPAARRPAKKSAAE